MSGRDRARACGGAAYGRRVAAPSAPAVRVPPALRQKIAADIKEVMEGDAIIKDRLNATAQLFAPGGPEEFAKSIEAQQRLLTAASDSARP